MAMHKNCIKYLAQPQAGMQTARYSAGPKGKQCNFNVLAKSTFYLPSTCLAVQNMRHGKLCPYYKHEKQRANLLKKCGKSGKKPWAG